jgi:hypothetical protein
MNSRYRMIDEMLRTWSNTIEDETLLESWEHMLHERVAQLRDQRRLSAEQILVGLRSCKRGTLLYAVPPGVPLRGHDKRVAVVAFHSFQPRVKRTWVYDPALKDPQFAHRVASPLSFNQAVNLQLARTEIAVRKRAPKDAPPVAVAEPPTHDLDDIPF